MRVITSSLSKSVKLDYSPKRPCLPYLELSNEPNDLHRRGIVQKMLHSSIYQTLQNSPEDLFCKFFITNTITTGFLLIDNKMLPVLTNKVTQMLLSKLKEKELRLLQSKPWLSLLLSYTSVIASSDFLSHDPSPNHGLLGGKEGFYLMKRTCLRRWAAKRRVIFWSSWMLMLPGILLV